MKVVVGLSDLCPQLKLCVDTQQVKHKFLCRKLLTLQGVGLRVEKESRGIPSSIFCVARHWIFFIFGMQTYSQQWRKIWRPSYGWILLSILWNRHRFVKLLSSTKEQKCIFFNVFWFYR
jgi:hypothetical protein